MNKEMRPFSTFEGNAVARRQANGNTGQSLTEGLIGSRFVLKLTNIDVDGVDHQVSLLGPGNKFPSTHIRFQSKFVLCGNWAVFNAGHAVDPDGNVRQDFFAFVHVEDGDQIRSYLLDADQISSLPRNDEGKPYFNSSVPGIPMTERGEVVRRLHRALDLLTSVSPEQAVANQALAYELRNKQFDDRPQFTYLLDRWKREGEEHGLAVPIIVTVNSQTNERRLLDARIDLFPFTATFWWGRSRAGSEMTAWSILAHHLGRTPTSDEVALFIEYALEELQPELDYDISTQEIADALQGKRSHYIRTIRKALAEHRE